MSRTSSWWVRASVDGLFAVGGLADEFQIGCVLNLQAESVADHGLVVGDADL